MNNHLPTFSLSPPDNIRAITPERSDKETTGAKGPYPHPSVEYQERIGQLEQLRVQLRGSFPAIAAKARSGRLFEMKNVIYPLYVESRKLPLNRLSERQVFTMISQVMSERKCDADADAVERCVTATKSQMAARQQQRSRAQLLRGSAQPDRVARIRTVYARACAEIGHQAALPVDDREYGDDVVRFCFAMYNELLLSLKPSENLQSKMEKETGLPHAVYYPWIEDKMGAVSAARAFRLR